MKFKQFLSGFTFLIFEIFENKRFVLELFDCALRRFEFADHFDSVQFIVDVCQANWPTSSASNAASAHRSKPVKRSRGSAAVDGMGTMLRDESSGVSPAISPASGAGGAASATASCPVDCGGVGSGAGAGDAATDTAGGNGDGSAGAGASDGEGEGDGGAAGGSA